VRENFKSLITFTLLTLAVFALAGCALPPENDPGARAEYEKINDPFEPTNRFIFSVNNVLDDAVIKPVTGIYRAILPDFIRSGVHNFFGNLKTPVTLANDILQGEPERAGNTVMRFLINTTLGVGGLWDRASSWGYNSHSEDFGQTMATWGVGEGPFLMLPIFGPSNPRDAIGKFADTFIDPINLWAANNDQEWVPLARAIGTGIDQRDQIWDILDDLKKSSVDYYAAIRSLYRQRRIENISNGKDSKNNPTPSLANSATPTDPDDQTQKSDAGPY
jgi:phospholipid-binding lipoprotein MlaA